MQYVSRFLFILVVCSLLFGCSKNDDPIPEENDGELITTLRLKFVNKNEPADQRTVTWKDVDGQGGNPPVIDSIILRPSATYIMTIDAILNESGSAPQDITTEIRQEADHHLFVYKPAGIDVNITATDKDSKGLPIGLSSDVRTGATSVGSLRVLLRHQVNSKDGTETPGSTDIDTGFPAALR